MVRIVDNADGPRPRSQSVQWSSKGYRPGAVNAALGEKVWLFSPCQPAASRGNFRLRANAHSKDIPCNDVFFRPPCGSPPR